MKKILALILAAVLCLSASACTSTSSDSDQPSTGSLSSEQSSENTDDTKESEQPADTTPMSESEIKQMYSDAEKFTGRTVTLSGKVFATPEQDENGIYFQMYADPEDSELNTVVAYADPDFELESGDYVKLTGVVYGEFEGTNAFGSTVTAPQIVASEMEISSYADVVSPALKTVTLEDASVTQHGYTVSLTKVEFAEKETRLYFTVENGGKATFNFYSFNVKLVQNGKQYEEETNYDADYPDIQSDLLPGVTSEGIVAFPALEPADFKVVLDAHSDDYDEDFENYTFDVTVK